MRCCNLLRHGQHYRAEAFAQGLRRHGYQVEQRWQRQPRPDDLLLIWNRTRSYEAMAQIYEAAGARVVVAENGYLDRLDGTKHYALALGGHNGTGRWFVGAGPRFEIEDEPWRKDGTRVLVLPQRGIGQKGVAMPIHWEPNVMDRLERITQRQIVLRRHPGHVKGAPPLDFQDIWCVVTWGSGAAMKALRAGVPVFHQLKNWIGAPGAAPLVDDIETRHTPDRHLLWTRVSWAQWSLEEIASGEAFDRLLHEEDRGLFRADQPALDHRGQGDGSGYRSPGVPLHA